MTNIFKNIYTGISAEAAIELLPQYAFTTTVAVYLPADITLLKKLYSVVSALSFKATFHFFFVLPPAVSSIDDMDAMGRFFFLNNYFAPNKNAPFLISNASASGIILQALNKWCVQQGFDEPDVVMVKGAENKEGSTCKAIIIPRPEQAAFFANLPKRLQHIDSLSEPVILHVADLNEVQLVEKTLKNFEAALQNENPQLHSLLTTLIKLQEENRQHAFRMRHMQQQIENLKEFNGLLRTTNEVEKILTFYHTQYEVLPLWYKRFGHIIKMMMGKREIPFISNKKES